ncbi:MAG: hypothetical protein R2991_12015 [Thermoanaerobaculia bacterium]
MSEPLRRRLRGALLRGLLPVVSGALAWLPWRALLAVGSGLGLLLYAVNGRERRRMHEHLAIAFPEMGADERRRLARLTARHHGMNLAEDLHLLVRGPGRVVPRIDVVGWEHVEAARTAGRPILFPTGHCGNWELLGAVLWAHRMAVYGMARGLQHSVLQDALVRLRESMGGRTIVRGARGGIRLLRRVVRGEAALVILIDQDTKVDGVWVPFFGRPAYTPTAAAELAARHDMAVLPAFFERLGDGTHRCTFQEPLSLPDDLTAATAALTETIERQIRRVPAQWVWMHRRWRRQPPDGS